MPEASKKKPAKQHETIEELVAGMTPENRATFEQIKEWQKGNEGLVDTAALIREVRGS